MPSKSPVKILHPDAKGRITLGAVAKGISSYRMTKDEQGRLVLEPFVEIPANLVPHWSEQRAGTGLQESSSGYRHGKGVVKHGLIDFIEHALGTSTSDIGNEQWATDNRPLGADFSD